MTTITFIGPGVMAEAMIAGILREKLASAEDIRVSGPRLRRGEFMNQAYGVAGFSDNQAAADGADIVVLSIKPQSLGDVLNDLAGTLKEEALVLSIIAGAPIKKLIKGLRHASVVRSMPNTPARIGMGISVWTASPAVTDPQRDFARRILAALGIEIFMEDEKYLDMATALSGTGPAYVFMFMEAMVDAGVHLGFPRRIAESLVVETVRGSVDYYLAAAEAGQIHLAGLRNDVTSPGGTTAAALYFLEKSGFRTALSRAIWAAYERSQELGKDPKAHAPEEM
ncbi:MAG TPA: pyrroline-5-carboxylate reductase [Anaerolineales bacterium]|nr:pyrroline-5-carboxylate reductase [Anaerolineales bacterium]